MQHTHTPVLLDPVLELLSPEWLSDQRRRNSLSGRSPHITCIDATLGLGGHALAIIDRLSEGDTYIGYDRDLDNLTTSQLLLSSKAQEKGVHLITHHASYRDIFVQHGAYDFILGDFGVSSVHYDKGELGFSTRHDGPLDMRFDRTLHSPTQTAAEYLKSVDKDELLRVLYSYGEERKARYIVEAILERRSQSPISSTHDLVDIIKGSSFDPKSSIRVFQAIRIAINQEFEELEFLISHIDTLLLPGGRIGLISFHSLEDRLIKDGMRSHIEDEIESWSGKIKTPAVIKKLSKKPIVASEQEVTSNPRSRSAKLRTYQKIFSK